MFRHFWFENASGRAGMYVKSSLQAARSFWTPREPVASHGDPFMIFEQISDTFFITWYASFLAFLSSPLSGLTSADSWTPVRSCYPHKQKSCCGWGGVG